VSRSYREMVERGRRQHGAKFDESALAPKWRYWYEQQRRIKVRTPYGEEITGTVSSTTGWRPSFMLMRRSNAMGSSDLLDSRDQLVGVWDGRQYRAPLPHEMAANPYRGTDRRKRSTLIHVKAHTRSKPR